MRPTAGGLGRIRQCGTVARRRVFDEELGHVTAPFYTFPGGGSWRFTECKGSFLPKRKALDCALSVLYIFHTAFTILIVLGYQAIRRRIPFINCYYKLRKGGVTRSESLGNITAALLPLGNSPRSKAERWYWESYHHQTTFTPKKGFRSLTANLEKCSICSGWHRHKENREKERKATN